MRHCVLMIRPLPQCLKEIADFPEDIRGDLADALARLDEWSISIDAIIKTYAFDRKRGS